VSPSPLGRGFITLKTQKAVLYIQQRLSHIHSATFVTHTCITLCLLARSREDHYFPITYIKKVYLNVDTDTYICSKLSTYMHIFVNHIMKINVHLYRSISEYKDLYSSICIYKYVYIYSYRQCHGVGRCSLLCPCPYISSITTLPASGLL